MTYNQAVLLKDELTKLLDDNGISYTTDLSAVKLAKTEETEVAYKFAKKHFLGWTEYGYKTERNGRNHRILHGTGKGYNVEFGYMVNK